jgi:PAS domain S-box-containing protein
MPDDGSPDPADPAEGAALPLRCAAATFEAAFAAAPIPAAVVEIGGARRLASVNRAFAELLGHRIGDPVTLRLVDIVTPSDLGTLDQCLAAVARGASGVEIRTVRWRGADGAEVVADTRVEAGSAGQAVVFLEASADPGSPVGVRDTRKLLQDIIDGVPALVFIKDLQHRYILANRRTRQLFGGECVGLLDQDIATLAEAQQFGEHDAEALAAGEPREFEEWALHDGERHTYYSLKFPLLDRENRAYALCGVSTDITAVKQAETTAREARDEAERANRAKSEFLSRVSHELRTPLHSILGYSQLLQVEGLALDVPATAGRMARAGQHLLELINDLLDVSRIEQGQDHVRLEPVHACDPVGAAVDIVRPLAAARDIELAVNLHGGIHEFVSADRRRLHQVLLNLMSNGINYNRPGGQVRVSFRRVTPGRLRFLVSDTGSGIRRQDFDRVFMPFERVDEHAHHREGAGLGLAVSKALIESMGGTIGIESSETGLGTTLFVDLQLVAPPENAHEIVFAARQPETIDRIPGCGQVLYIEDHAANFDLIEQTLGRAGDLTLVPAPLGEIGLQLARELVPDLILLDLHLPDLPGETVLVRLKDDPRTRDIPVVVLSADATPAQMARARAAGAQHYLTKPLDLLEFVRVVATLLADGPEEKAQ